MTPLLIWAFAAMAAAVLLLLAAAGAARTPARSVARPGNRTGADSLHDRHGAAEEFGPATGGRLRGGHPSVGWLTAAGAARDPRIAAAAWDGAARADRPIGR